MTSLQAVYRPVIAFERALCDYTGAPYAVAVNSCTNALLLALTWERLNGVDGPIRLPRRTYIGVLQSVLNAGFEVEWIEDDWWQTVGYYRLAPAHVWDAARHFNRLKFPFTATIARSVCVSFHAAKQLPLGRGGAILTDNPDAAHWFRAARMDGRPPGDDQHPVFPAFHCPLPPDVAARGVDILARWNRSGYQPRPLPREEYPDLSQWWPKGDT